MHHIRPRLVSHASSTPLLRGVRRPTSIPSINANASSPSLNPKSVQVAHCRHFHITRPRQGSPFFQLGALSNSRESQYFSKASGLSPVEHSTNLELIRSSEVKPFEGKAKQCSKNEHSRDRRRRQAKQQVLLPQQETTSNLTNKLSSPQTSSIPSTPVRSTPSASDSEALKVGHFILRTRRLQVSHLRRLLRQSKRQAAAAQARLETTSKNLKNEMRGASAAILLTIGIATGLVSWWAWPKEGVARKPRMGGWSRDTTGESIYPQIHEAVDNREWPFKLRSATDPPTVFSTTMPKANTGTTILITSPNALPSGWEKARSADGQTYYIDHNTRTTSWEPPTIATPKTWTMTVTSPTKSTPTEEGKIEKRRQRSETEKNGQETKTWSWSGNLFWSS